MSDDTKPAPNSIEALMANEGTKHGIFFTEWNPAIPFKCPEGCTQVKFRVRSDEFVKVAMRFDDGAFKACDVGFDREAKCYVPAHCFAAHHYNDAAASSYKRRIEELQTQVGVAYSNGQADARREMEISLKAFELSLSKARAEHFKLIEEHDALRRDLFCAHSAMLKANAGDSRAIKEGRKAVDIGVTFIQDKSPITQEIKDNLRRFMDAFGMKGGFVDGESTTLLDTAKSALTLKQELVTERKLREEAEASLAAQRKAHADERASRVEIGIKLDDLRDLHKQTTAELEQTKEALALARKNNAALRDKVDANCKTTQQQATRIKELENFKHARECELEKERDAFGLKAKQLAEQLDRLERASAECHGAASFEAMKARFVEADASARLLNAQVGENKFGQEYNCSVREDERQAKLKAEGYDPEAKAWVQAASQKGGE